MSDFKHMQGYIISAKDIQWDEPTKTDVELELERKHQEWLTEREHKISGDHSVKPRNMVRILSPKEYGMTKLSQRRNDNKRFKA